MSWNHTGHPEDNGDGEGNLERIARSLEHQAHCMDGDKEEEEIEEQCFGSEGGERHLGCSGGGEHSGLGPLA